MRPSPRALSGLALASAVGIALPCLLVPLRNPDVYWHLSAARAMARQHAVPTSDFLSHTLQGSPWLDFEWLSQLVYLAAWTAAGCRGLVALRVVVLGAALAVDAAVAALGGAALAGAAVCAAVFAAAIFPYADLRPDNFSLLFFALELCALEALRRGRLRPGPRLYAAAAGVYALWANLHLGLVFGLVLLVIYAVGSAIDAQRASLEGAPARSYLALAAAGALGSLANPYSWRLYSVVSQHAAFLHTLALTICEWKPPELDAYWLWPYAALLVGSLVLALVHFLKVRKASFAPLLSLCYFGIASTLSQRHLTFFCAIAAPAAVSMMLDLGARRAKALRIAGAAALLALAGYVWRVAAPMLSRDVCGETPCALADFLRDNASELAGKRLYNTWEDGGYLGFRLYPGYRVFYDGRYIFHERLQRVLYAASSAENWRAFSAEQALEVVSMRRSHLHTDDELLTLGDGRRLFVERPYYDRYLPARDWALVYWDDRRFVAVRRGLVSPSWLKAHEYRYLLPDDPGLQMTLETSKRPPLAALRAELERHRAEAASSPAAVAETERLETWLRGLEGRAKSS